MRKKINLKSTILGIIVGGIVFGSIGVVATNYLLKAEDVEYKNNQNLQDALDELYGMAANHCPDGKTCLTDEEKTTLQNTYLNECPSGKECLTSSEYTSLQNSCPSGKVCMNSGATMKPTNLVSLTGTAYQGLLGIVYLDPTDLTRECNSSNSVSTTGTKTGCMKWYAYKLENGNYSLLLDHNTTAMIAYNTTNSNENYGTTSGNVGYDLAQLTNVSGWVVTPRLISAEEIKTITGNTSWNSGGSYYYFDSKTTTQTAKSQGASAYAWLFDYTNGCTSYGCNTADSSNYGYWTSTKYSGNSDHLWFVYCTGNLNYDYASSTYRGLRPVITVPSSILNIS